MEERICDLVKRILETDEEITIETEIEDVDEWDSFGQVAIMSEIEKCFQIKISYEDMITMNSIKTIIKVVEKYV